MALADELMKLQELRNSGALTEAEFAQAKSRVLATDVADTAHASPPGPADRLANAAQTWVNYQMVLGIIGFILAAIFFVAIWLPGWNRVQDRHDEMNQPRIPVTLPNE